MRGRDIEAVGELAGEASNVVTTLVRDMHAGIAGRVFGGIGPSSKPTQVIHDGIARTVYGTVDHGLRGATKAGGVLASQVWSRDCAQCLLRFGHSSSSRFHCAPNRRSVAM
jgi:hypothetical protein